MPLRLTRENIGEVDFHERNLHSRKRVANGEARVAISARIHKGAIRTTAQPLHSVDDLTFAVVL